MIAAPIILWPSRLLSKRRRAGMVPAERRTAYLLASDFRVTAFDGPILVRVVHGRPHRIAHSTTTPPSGVAALICHAWELHFAQSGLNRSSASATSSEFSDKETWRCHFFVHYWS